MALNSSPKKINTLIRKYTCVVNEHEGPIFYPYQYQNQRTLDEMDEVLRAASAADVNYKDAWGEPTLILAVTSAECVRRLLTVDGIDVNIVNEKGNTALIEATMAGNGATVGLLLEKEDIDVNHRNKTGNTALLIAARSSRNFVLTQLLKDPRVDVQATNRMGRTAFMCACSDAPDMATVRLLLESKRIDVNWANKDGQTALQVASTIARKVVQAHFDATAMSVAPIPTVSLVPTAALVAHVCIATPSTTATISSSIPVVNPVIRIPPGSPVIVPTPARSASPAGSVLARAQAFGSTTRYPSRPSTPVVIRSKPTAPSVVITPSAANTIPKGDSSSSPRSITFRGAAPAPTRRPIPIVRSTSPAATVLVRAQTCVATTPPVSGRSFAPLLKHSAVSRAADFPAVPYIPATVAFVDSPRTSVSPSASAAHNCNTNTADFIAAQSLSTESVTCAVSSPTAVVACAATPVSNPITPAPPVGTGTSPISIAANCISPSVSRKEATVIPPAVRVPDTPLTESTPFTLPAAAATAAGVITLSSPATAIPSPAHSNGYTSSVPPPAISWLTSNLLHSGFDSHLVQLCEQKLVVELGLVSERILALLAPTEFNAEYLTGLGITVIGLQKHLLALHRKLYTQYTPRDVVTDAEMQERVRALENTVKALQVAVHEQKIVNKVQQERFDGIMTLLDIHLECQNKKYTELQRNIQKEQSTIEDQVKKLRKQK